MDKIIVEEKLASLSDHIEWIEEIAPDRYDVLEEDRLKREGVVLNIILAVQDCVDIAMHAIAQAGNERPANMREAFNSLRRMGAISDTTAKAMKDAVCGTSPVLSKALASPFGCWRGVWRSTCTRAFVCPTTSTHRSPIAFICPMT